MSTPILPFAVWASGTNQNSIPANDNSLRNQILNGMVIDDATMAQPGSPSNGDIYIIPPGATGAQWATFDAGDLAIYSSGTWYAFAPVEGVVVNFYGSQKQWVDGSPGGWGPIGVGAGAWDDLTGVPAPIEDLAALADPGADRILFWDDSAGEYTHLAVGSGLSISMTTLSATGGGSGDVSGPSSSVDNTLPRFDSTTGKLLQASGVVVSDNDEISGFKGNINRQTGTTYTLQASDSGKIVELANAASITLTLPNSLATGFNCTLVQDGAGQVTLSAASGASIKNRQSHTKLAGDGAMASLYVSSNAGSAAAYRFGGDTAS